MPQRYRLRLGDGTILQVDKEGLLGWREDGRAVVQVAGTSQWRPLREFLADEESAARLARALVRPEPRSAPAPPPPEVEPPSPAFEPVIGVPPVQALAEEPSAPPPPWQAPPEAPPPSPAIEPAIGEPPVQALAEEPSVRTPPWQVPPEAPGTEAPAIRLKPLEDEPHDRAAEPEIVEEEPQDPYALPRPRAYDAMRVEEAEEGEERHDRLEGPLLQVVAAFGSLLSRLLDPLTPLVRGWPSRSAAGRAPVASARWPPKPTRVAPRAPAPPAPVAPPPSSEPPPAFASPPAVAPPPELSVLAEDPSLTAASRPGRDELPAIPLKPLEEDEHPLANAWRGFSEKVTGWVARFSEWFAGVSAWVAGLSGRVERLRERSRRPEPAVPPFEPARWSAPSTTPRAPEPFRPTAPLRPPTPIAELPSIRLAQGYEAPEEGDLYDGEVETESVFIPVLWLWTKRIVLAGALVAVGVLAARNWDTWFPRAAELGQTVFTEIDRQAHSAQRAREREQALTNATEQCPHLAPATIRVVLSTSREGVLEPPEVFQLATEAADRGISSLAPAEAAELRGLQRELVANLRPPQRARLADYDRARATRGVFPFENPHALDLVARGARAMPAASRARLQELLGKAVAAGLGLPPGSPGGAPADEGVSAPR